MYAVSNAYILALHSPVQRRRVRGTVNGRSFTEADILTGSLNIKNQCANGSDVKLGAVFIGQLSLTFLKSFTFQRGTWKNAEVKLSIGLEVADGVFEDVPCGVFTVSEATHSEVGVNITAYDHMAKLDKGLSITNTSGQPYDILKLIATNTGVELGFDRAYIESLPNGSKTLGLYSPNDVETYRDLVSWLSQTLGSFATFDRQGKLLIRGFGDRVIDLTGKKRFNPDQRMKGGKWSDFTSRYTGLSVVNMEDKTTSYIHVSPDNGLTMNLGPNPFMQYGTDTERDAIRRTVLAIIAEMAYTPFTVSLLGDMCFDLGDEFEFPDGIADTARCCMMAYSYTYNKSFNMQGFGKDPALEGVKSKEDKNIAGLSGDSKNQVDQYYSFSNTKLIQAPEMTETPLGSIRFLSSIETYVDIWHEIQLQTDGMPSIAQLKYYLDGELIPYSPVETWSMSGKHLMTTHYLIKAEPNKAHTWAVNLVMNEGSAYISLGNANFVLHGQGLITDEEWDGYVELSDYASFKLETPMLSINLTETHSNEMQVPKTETINEQVAVALGGHFRFRLNERIEPTFIVGSYQLTTEAGEPIIAEDGKTIYSEGG